MKHKMIVIFYTIATISAILIRSMEMLFVTDPLTGFFKSDLATKGWSLNVVTLLVLAAVFVTGTLSRRVARKHPPINKPLAVLSFMTALAIVIYQAIAVFLSGMESMNIIILILALPTSLFFIFFGLRLLLGIGMPKFLPIAIIPYWISKIMELFIKNTGMANISETVFETIMLILVLLFFLAFAKFESEVYVARNARKCLPLGLSASLMCFVCTVPKCIMLVTGNESVLHETLLPNFSIMAVGIFMLSFTLTLFSRKNIEKRQIEKDILGVDNTNYRELNAAYFVEKK